VLTSFTLSLSLVALACLFYKIRQKTLEGPVVLAGHEVPNSLLYSLAIIICIPLFYWAGASQTIGWIMGSSIFLIFLHSALYVSEEQPEAELEAVTIA
jgi:Na+/citrate or Na+/malate symporter